jgi:hypothetical protein
MQRRDFLKATTSAPFLGAAMASPQPTWYGRPMRWAQLAFVEDDPGNYDPGFWLEYFRRIHADGACLSAGGCVAFYPTKIPMHYRSKWLGDRDCFGELLQGCRHLGMNVIARTDSHAVHQDVKDAHPDWIAVDADGHPRRHPSDRDFWIACALGPYNFEFMTAVHEEIMSLYRVDGVFTNRWAGSGMCYCAHCREDFKKLSGLELPRTNNPQDRARREYIVWHQGKLFELWRLWDSRLKAINPDSAYIANAGGGALSELDMKTIGELAPTLFADRQARRGLMPPWTNGKNGKEYRATLGRKAIAGIFSVGLEEEYRWKDSVQAPAEIRLWVADGIAHDLRPWFVKFNAKPIDRRWLPVVEDIYKWHHANEDFLRNERSLARVAVVYSQQTATFYGGEKAHEIVEAPTLGIYQALIESRIPFDMVHDRKLDPESLAPYRTLILPNIAALSEGQCRQLEAFVQGGGSIVATYQTSMFDEWGIQRADLGLSDLFGVSYSGSVPGPMLNSYLSIDKNSTSGQFHPLVRGLEDAGKIINGVHRVRVRPKDPSYRSPLGLIPTYPDLPMEEVFVRPGGEREDCVFVRELGAGRVVYFPFDLGRTFWEILNPDHLLLLRNAVLWATNEQPVLSVNGPGLLDLSVWQQQRSLTVHLVNLTNPMMMKGPIRQVISLPKQEVCVKLPPAVRPKGVRLLVAGHTVPFRVSNQCALFDVPGVNVHEIAAIEFS